MFFGERKIRSLAKTTAFVLFMLLMSSYFERETVIIMLLCMIYTKMGEE
jgi:hypothetical protein